jgi:tetratricopeptide (TPR) repeat protein
MSAHNVELALPPGERQSLLGEIASVDRDVEDARRADDKQKLLVQLERGLSLRRRLSVESSYDVAAACRRLCEACNSVATSMLQEDNLRGALDLLKRAEEVASKNEVDRAITYNNLACYYRRTGKLRTAVKYLEAALAIEEYSGRTDAAQTRLNLCATLSQLRRHGEALAQAQTALIRIYEILAPLMIRGEVGKAPEPGAEAPAGANHEQVTVLCIAYHNLAVEHEYLQSYESAICAHAQGYYWATSFLSEGNPLIGILHDSVQALKAKLPPHSRAVGRAAELMEGRGSTGLGTGGSTAVDLNLLTPRQPAADAGEPDSGGDSPQ